MIPPLFDAHCHYHHLGRYRLSQRINHWSELIQPPLMGNHDVVACLCATTVDDCHLLLEDASSEKRRYLTCLGVHPWYVTCQETACTKTVEDGAIDDETVSSLRSLLEARRDCHVGEIGLDRHYASIQSAPDLHWQKQWDMFQKQWQLAHEYNRVASIHCVKAWHELLIALKRSGQSDSGFILHAFSAPESLIKAFTELNAYYSFSMATLSRPKVRHLLKRVPGDRVLLETDAPYMVPSLPMIHLNQLKQTQQDPEELNHPANLYGAYRIASDLLDTSLTDLAVKVWRNACAIFPELKIL